MTHDQLVERAVKWLRGKHKCSVVFAEIVTSARAVPDAIGFTGWGCVLVECKRTRSDFLADRRKPSHRAKLLPGRHRWYLAPPGIIQPEDLRDGWGLATTRGKRVTVVVEAKPQEDRESAMREEQRILLSAIRRHQLGVEWVNKRARFVPAFEEAVRPVKTHQRPLFK